MAARRSTSPSMPPTTGAARRPAGSSRRPRSGCSPPCWSSSPPARALGEEAFAAWGWRIPFLVSVVLLAISVWMRVKLSESPTFAKLRDEGESSKAPLREAFAERASLKQVLIAFFGHHVRARGGVVFHLFLHAGVPRKVARHCPARPRICC